MKIENEKNIGCDYLKAISCMGIFLAHSCAYAEMYFPGMEYCKTLNYLGRYGMLQYVAFFFLITGYFVTGQIDNQKYKSTEFLKKRFLSIYPMYWTISALLLVLKLSFFHSFTTSAGFWKSFLLIAGEQTTVCLDEWTLWLQILFYLIAALFFQPYLRKIYPVVLLIGFSTICFLNINQLYMIGVSYPVIIRALPMGTILLGGGLYYFEKYLLKDRGTLNKKHAIGSMVCFLIIFTIMNDYVNVINIHIYVPLYYFIGAISFIAFKSLPKLKCDRFLMCISSMSFPIYLLHPSIFTIVFTYIVNKGLVWSKWTHLFAIAVSFAICMGLARLSILIVKKFE